MRFLLTFFTYLQVVGSRTSVRVTAGTITTTATSTTGRGRTTCDTATAHTPTETRGHSGLGRGTMEYASYKAPPTTKISCVFNYLLQ